MPTSDTRLYRPCVGAMILNGMGLAWIGKRRLEGPGSDKFAWQMPQGGLDPGEDPLAAARREVHEETGMRSLNLLAEAPDWYSYDLPAEVLQSGPWKGKYRGQTQKWFAFRFTGDDSEIDVANPPNGAEVEFVDWRWERIERLPELIIPFKRAVYEEVVAAFAHLVAAAPVRPD